MLSDADLDGKTEEQLTCGVCYSSVVDDKEEGLGEKIFGMPRCHHIFHEACVTKWLFECKAACPTCHEGLGEGVGAITDGGEMEEGGPLPVRSAGGMEEGGRVGSSPDRSGANGRSEGVAVEVD